MKPKRFGDTLPVRIAVDVNRQLARIASSVGISKSDVVRIAINIGLPALERGEIRIPHGNPDKRSSFSGGGRLGAAIVISALLAGMAISAHAPGSGDDQATRGTMPLMATSAE